MIKGENGQGIADDVQSAHRSYGFSGVVLAAKVGQVQCAIALGNEGSKPDAPRQTTTLFEIASATKPITAIAALVLEEQGKLKLNDSIAKYLPGVPDDCRPITVGHLIRHTTGIPSTNTRGSDESLSDVLPLFLRGGPRHTPGTHCEYWNQGYALLSEIIAKASGQSYVHFMRTAIFEKCGMTDSGFTGYRAPHGVRVAVGKSTRGADRSALHPPYGASFGFPYGGIRGMVTNVWDLWRLDRALHARRILSAKTIARMTTPGVGGFGLGGFCYETNKETHSTATEEACGVFWSTSIDFPQATDACSCCAM